MRSQICVYRPGLSNRLVLALLLAVSALHTTEVRAQSASVYAPLSGADKALIRDVWSGTGNLDKAQAALQQSRPDLAHYLKHDNLDSARKALYYLNEEVGAISLQQRKQMAIAMEKPLRGDLMRDTFGVKDAHDYAPDPQNPNRKIQVRNPYKEAFEVTRSGNNPTESKGVYSDEDVQTKFEEQYAKQRRIAQETFGGSGIEAVDEAGRHGFRIKGSDTVVWKPTQLSFEKTLGEVIRQGLPYEVQLPKGASLGSELSLQQLIDKGARVTVTINGEKMTLIKPPALTSFEARTLEAHMQSGNRDFATGANPDLPSELRNQPIDSVKTNLENLTKAGKAIFENLGNLHPEEAQRELWGAAKDLVRSMTATGLCKGGMAEQCAKLNAYRNMDQSAKELGFGTPDELQKMIRDMMGETFRQSRSLFQNEFDSLLQQIKQADPSAKAGLLDKIKTMEANLIDMAERFETLSAKYKEGMLQIAGEDPRAFYGEQMDKLWILKNAANKSGLAAVAEGAGVKDKLPTEPVEKIKPGGTEESPGKGQGQAEGEPGKAGGKPKPGATGENPPVENVAEGGPGKGTAQEPPGKGPLHNELGPADMTKINVFLNTGQFVACMERRPPEKSVSEWTAECAKEQAKGYALGELIGAGIRKIAFYAPKAGVLAEVIMLGIVTKATGDQLGDLFVETIQLPGAFMEVFRAYATSDATTQRRDAVVEAFQRGNVPRLAKMLAAQEKLVRDSVDDLARERRKLADDIERLGRQQDALLAKTPSPAEYDKRTFDFMTRLLKASNDCEQGKKNTALNTLGNSQDRLQDLVLEQTLDKAMRLVKSCKSADELKEADAAMQRARDMLKSAAADNTESLLNDAVLYGNSIKDIASAAESIAAEKALIPGRIKAFDTAFAKKIKDLNQDYEKFINSFPPALIDMMKLNSKRIQQMRIAIDKATVGDRGIYAHGTKDLQDAYDSIARQSLEGLIAYPKGANFRHAFDTLVYDIAKCRGGKTGSGTPGNKGQQALSEKVEKEYQGLREACAAKLKQPAKPAQPENPEEQTFSPVFLFRVWEDDPKKAQFMFYVKADGGGGWFHFPDGSGGMYHRRGENLGQYRDARSVCAVLRGYGVSFVEYNLGWAPHVRCNKDGPIQAPAKPADSGGTAAGVPPAAAGSTGSVQANATGSVTIHSANGATQPFSDKGAIPYGAVIETGKGGQASFTSPGGTMVTVGAGSRVRVAGPAAGGNRQVVEVVGGSVDINRPPGLPGADDVLIKSRDAHSFAIGTRYKVTVTERGTAYQVSEGVIRVSGNMLARTDANFDVPGKYAFQKELDLRAGDKGFAFNTTMEDMAAITKPSAAAPAAAPLARPDPWNDLQVQQLIDEWLEKARPAVSGPGPWRFTEWGQLLGPGSKAGGAPDHPAGWSRHQSMWAVRMKFDSLNLCTMGEFIERRIGGKNLDGCNKAAPQAAVPSWVVPSAPAPLPQAGGGKGGSKADAAIAAAREEVAQLHTAPPPREPVAPPIQHTEHTEHTERISVQSAVYGPNCNRSGDITRQLAQACDSGNPQRCDYRIDHRIIGDPAIGCYKDFVYRWKCLGGSDGSTHEGTVRGEASGKTATLTCPAGATASVPAPASTVDFSGEWACNIKTERGTAALFPTITKSGAGYDIETLTSGVQGLVRAASSKVEGNRISVVHRFSYGSMTITVEKNNNTLTGTYHEKRDDGSTVNYPLACTLASTSKPAAPVAARKPRGLLDKIDAIPDNFWAAGRPDFNAGDFRQALALVAEVDDPRLHACNNAAKRKGLTVVGFTSRNNLEHARWSGTPPFPLAISHKARDMIYAIEGAAGHAQMLVPIPFAYAYLIDSSGRVVDSGPCERLLDIPESKKDQGIPGGRK